MIILLKKLLDNGEKVVFVDGRNWANVFFYSLTFNDSMIPGHMIKICKCFMFVTSQFR